LGDFHIGIHTVEFRLWMTALREATTPVHTPSCPVSLIAGPTASGKSALAVRMALAIDGEIVNADSMQIYHDLRVLTARPSPDQEAAARHHLFGVVDGALAWSVGHWLRAIGPILADIAARGRPAIVVGGTGLYFHALTRGLAEVPQVAEPIRAASARRLAEIGETAFRATLGSVDPAAELRISPGDGQRLIRALAVFNATGRSLSDWQGATKPILPAGAWRGVVVNPPREVLYGRCDARLEQMLVEGALDEVAALMARRLDPGLPVMKALGVPPFAAHVRGEMSRIDALARAQMDTRHYAKRQTTWLRNQTQAWPRIETADAARQWEALSHWVFHAPLPALTLSLPGGMD
jgi:tRNA dimethylallyltransferase